MKMPFKVQPFKRLTSERKLENSDLELLKD
jgi:hypothetical protein